MDLGSEDLKSQVFATIYETEGLAHHMAVERAHVSWLHIEKQESHVKQKVPVRHTPP